MRSRQTSTASRHLGGLQVGQRGDRLGRVDDHLVRAGGGLGGEQVGVGLRRGSRGRRASAPGRGSGPRAPSSRACRARRRRGAARGPRAACGPRGPPGTGRCRSTTGSAGATSNPPPGRSPRASAMIALSPLRGSTRISCTSAAGTSSRSASQVAAGRVAALVGEARSCPWRRRTPSRGSWPGPSARGRSSRRDPRRRDTASGSAPRSATRGRPLVACALTPTKAISRPRSVATCWRIGSSARHGPHHDAHLLTTTGCPRRAACASRTPPCRRRAAGWTARGARPAARASRAGAPGRARGRSRLRASASGGASLPPACVRPMTSTATEPSRGEERECPAHRHQGRTPQWRPAAVCFNSGLTRGRPDTRGYSRSEHPLGAIEPVSLPAELRAVPAALRFLHRRFCLPWPNPRQWPIRSRTLPLPPTSNGPSSSPVSRSWLRGRGARGRARAGHARAASRWTPRWPSSTPACSSPRSSGAAGSRSCSASSGCSARRSRSWSTAPCCPPTRSTRCPAR